MDIPLFILSLPALWLLQFDVVQELTAILKIKIKPLTTSNGRPTQYGLLGPNLVPRVFKLLGQMGNAGKTAPLRVGSKGAILNDSFLIRKTRFRKKSRIATHCQLTFERYWKRIPNQTVQSRSISHHKKPVLTWLWASDGTWPKKSHVIKAKKTMLIHMHEL